MHAPQTWIWLLLQRLVWRLPRARSYHFFPNSFWLHKTQGWRIRCEMRICLGEIQSLCPSAFRHFFPQPISVVEQWNFGSFHRKQWRRGDWMYCFNRPEKNIRWLNLHLPQMTILVLRGHRVVPRVCDNSISCFMDLSRTSTGFIRRSF